MKTKGQKSFLSGVPGWALALIVMFLFIVVFIVFPERFVESERGEVLTYAILGVIDAVCCFFITRQNPWSFWYVFLIINAPFIFIAVIAEDMNTTKWITFCIIWAVSIIASITGARIGKMKAREHLHTDLG